MLLLLDQLRTRPLSVRSTAILGYGLLSFALIYLAGYAALDNPLLFRIFELAWFVHIVFLASKIYNTQREFIILALLGLAPGLINNISGLFLL